LKILVTGGGGFLGGAVVRLLNARGDAVRSFTRSNYPWLAEIGVEQAFGDLADQGAVTAAAEGCDAVLHVAGKAGVWGRYDDYYATNVTGTVNVLTACRVLGIRRLVYTGTPSVVHTGRDIEGGNESLPYATRFLGPYPETKAAAEKKVLSANGPDFATVALRPHLIWGPGDPHLIPRLLTRARAGKIRRVGDRNVTVDVTYVDNAAAAHVLALDRLDVGSPIAGRPYFITNGEPVDLYGFINRILATAKLPPVEKTVSVRKAKLAGWVLEKVYSLFKLTGEPAMTRFLASQLSTSHWFDISAARQDLGYEPRVSLEEGLKRLGPFI
jgi:nucleoside-diphosphate-sugar epimerase